MKFQAQEIPIDFEYKAKNYVTKTFNAKKEAELVEYFKTGCKITLWPNKKKL